MTESSGTGSPPRITVRGGAEDGTVLELEGSLPEWLIGSDPECHLVLDRPGVSPVHARLFFDQRGLVLADASSAWGTFVGGEKIEAEQVVADGDEISLGPPGADESATLEASVPGVSAAAPAPPPVPVPPSSPPPPARAVEPDYLTEGPSMLPLEHPAGPPEVPPLPPRPRPPGIVSPRPSFTPRPLPRGRWTRMAVAAGAGLLIALAALVLLRRAQAPGPVLSGVLPSSAHPGGDVAISGSGFAADAAGNQVLFGEVAGTVASAGPGRLVVTVPEALAAKAPLRLPVSVETGGARSNALFLRVFNAPRIRALDPPVGLPGDRVTASGDNLNGKALEVTVNGVAATVAETRPGAIVFTIPALSAASGQTVKVAVRVDSDWGPGADLVIGHPPIVMGISPTDGPVGEPVTLRGYGFDPDPAKDTVLLGDRPALVVSASDTEIRTSVPSQGFGPSRQDLGCRVRVGGKESSNPCRFTLRRPSSTIYAPRFVGEPGPEGVGAAVSLEVAPLVVLSGAAAGSSPAERAVTAAEALNSLASSASPRSPVSFEARGRTVVEGGRGLTLLEATPEDATGYARFSRRRAPSTAGLAAHWAALLQDTFDLFIQWRRPYHLLESSVEGRAFTDLYREARRRVGGGSGVVVSLLGEATQAALRGAALGVPAQAPPPGAVVEGSWTGTFQEGGGSERPLDLRLSLQAGRLQGTLFTRAGKVSGEMPLRQITYRDGTIRFLVDSGGVPRLFRGTFSGDAITGTLMDPGGSQPLGRFSLRYVP